MPYDAALSDEPCPTMRTSRKLALANDAPRSRAISSSCSSRRRSAAGCSRISARKRRAGRHCRLSLRHVSRLRRRADDLEVVVEDDEVRRPAHVDPAELRAPRTRAGTARGGLERPLERDVRRRRRFRTASIIVSALPASTPSSRRTTSSATTISISPSAYVPSPRPAPAIASVTSASRPAGERARAVARCRDRGGCRRRSPGRRRRGAPSAAPTIPGSRCASGRMALKTWVTVRTPRSNAACASRRRRVAVAERDRHAARVEDVDQLERARQLGRERHQPDRPAASRRSSSAGSGSRRGRRPCVPSRAGRGTGLRDGRRGCAGPRRVGRARARSAATRSSSSG